ARSSGTRCSEHRIRVKQRQRIKQPGCQYAGKRPETHSANTSHFSGRITGTDPQTRSARLPCSGNADAHTRRRATIGHDQQRRTDLEPQCVERRQHLGPSRAGPFVFSNKIESSARSGANPRRRSRAREQMRHPEDRACSSAWRGIRCTTSQNFEKQIAKDEIPLRARPRTFSCQAPKTVEFPATPSQHKKYKLFTHVPFSLRQLIF